MIVKTLEVCCACCIWCGVTLPAHVLQVAWPALVAGGHHRVVVGWQADRLKVALHEYGIRVCCCG